MDTGQWTFNFPQVVENLESFFLELFYICVFIMKNI